MLTTYVNVQWNKRKIRLKVKSDTILNVCENAMRLYRQDKITCSQFLNLIIIQGVRKKTELTNSLLSN